jgi:hypothetical protein
MDNAERRKELASLSNMTGAVIGVIALAVTRLSQLRSLVVKGDNKLREWVELAINDALEERSVTLDHPGYHRLWDSLNGNGAWEANPFVVAVAFRVERGSINCIGALK